jgi:hypothetical protein
MSHDYLSQADEQWSYLHHITHIQIDCTFLKDLKQLQSVSVKEYVSLSLSVSLYFTLIISISSTFIRPAIFTLTHYISSSPYLIIILCAGIRSFSFSLFPLRRYLQLCTDNKAIRSSTWSSARTEFHVAGFQILTYSLLDKKIV